MRRARLIILLGLVAGSATPMVSCEKNKRDHENGGRRIVHALADPSGKWVAIVDEVEYANGLLTSLADRVRVVQSESQDAEGTLVLSADALPDSEKPTVAWAAGRIQVTVSQNATVLHQEAQAHGFEVEVRRR